MIGPKLCHQDVPRARFLVGDTRKVLASMPAASVDLVMTSPPFLALRSYLPADHPHKSLEMGSEATPGEYLDAVLDVIEECRRVLAPHGSLCIELGDTYSGTGGQATNKAWRAGTPRADRPHGIRTKTYEAEYSARSHCGTGWPTPKSLCMIPEMVRFSLAYGLNPFTGREIEPWRIRNVVRWHRPNPPVGALGDKFRPATTDMLIACTAKDRYFDLDAVRGPLKVPEAATPEGARHKHKNHSGANPRSGWTNDKARIMSNPGGSPPLDTWTMTAQPFKGSHYATFPEALCVRPIRAMCPTHVCTVCRQPSRRMVETVGYKRLDSDKVPARLTMLDGTRLAEGVNQHRRPDGGNTSVVKVVRTTGWTDCGHRSWRHGVVLDPFAGSGTALKVAVQERRDALGIDLDERNVDLAIARVPVPLEVEYL